MEKSIFRYILRYSTPQQFYLIAITVASYPFLFMSLELPKIIVNEAIDGHGPPFVFRLMGYEADIESTQIQFLLGLSLTYLFLVLMNGAFKYHINVYKGQLSERLLRRLRYQLYERVLRFPLPRFRKLGQGEIIPIITAEVEPLGGFIGSAYADPMFFGGQLVIILTFIVLQDPLLGLAAIAFYPLQIYLIPKLQRRVNQLAKQRIHNVRRLSDHIGESVSGIVELRANNTAAFELSRFTQRLGRIYSIRFEIYRRKFFIKFLNNFIDKLTPFFFFSIGGYLVIRGDLTLGALIAVLAAYKDLAAPWKEMLVWYQQKEDVKIKYEQVIEQFSPEGMETASPGSVAAAATVRLDGETSVNVTLTDEDGVRRLDGALLTLPPGSHTAIVGDVACGKSELAMVMAGLQAPTYGKVIVGGQDVAALPAAVGGRRLGYVGAHTYLNNISVGENLIYGLKNRLPVLGDDRSDGTKDRHAAALDEAARSGNSPFDYTADWIDYEAAGVEGPEALRRRLVEVLGVVELDGDVYGMGLRGCIDPDLHAETARKILRARTAMRSRMEDPAVALLVEPFDKNRYNGHATVGENLLFGAPLDGRFDMERLAEHPYVQSVLDRAGLTQDFVEVGRRVAETMIELFADLPPDHEFFQQYSFIAAADLPVYRSAVAHAARWHRAVARGPATPPVAALHADRGAPSSRPDRHGDAGAHPGRPACLRRRAPRRAQGRHRLLRREAVQPGGHDPGQHPVRQAGARSGLCGTDHRPADPAGGRRAGPARGDHRGGAACAGRHWRRAAVLRPAPEGCPRPGAPEASRHPDRERGDGGAGRREPAPRAAQRDGGKQGPDRGLGHQPARRRARVRPDRGHEGRQGRRARQFRKTGGGGRERGAPPRRCMSGRTTARETET